MNASGCRFRPWLLLAALLFLFAARGETATQNGYRIDYPLTSPYYPLVLRAETLPFVVNAQANWVSFYAVIGNSMQPVPFQIDKVDKSGRYEFASDEREKRAEAKARIDANDEIAFMVGDLGSRWSGSLPGVEPLTEIQFVDPAGATRRWLYARVGQRRDLSRTDYVQYEADADFISGRSYRVGFSDATPFLLDHLQRKDNADERWSANLVDTMKVHHNGKFLHKFDFVRDHDDYRSRVVAVKDGPVRVIRRTHNNVRMIWFLNTPTIEVDFVAYANSFYVDTLLDIPFKIGNFFSGLDTRFSIDWRTDVGLENARLHSPGFTTGLPVDGKMSPDKQAMNQLQDTQLLFSSRYGDMLVTLGIPDDLPLEFRTFIHDDRTAADPPETIPGQFGNFGFLTTNWEAVNTELHHIMFHVYLTPTSDTASALDMLSRAPRFNIDAIP